MLFLLGRLEVHPIALTVLFAALVLVLRTTARIPRLGEPSGLAILAKDRRPPVLLLSRALRGTWLEELIEPVASKLGPFVAITGPGGPSIYMGARRIACDAARGEELFRAAVRAAAAVVVLAPDAADVAEDLKIVAAEGARDRLFIVVPGGGDLLPLREAARGVLDIPDTVDTDVAHAIRFGLEPAAIRCDGRRWRRGFRTQAADALLRAFARR